MGLFGKAAEKRAFVDGDDTDCVRRSCEDPVDEDYEYRPHRSEDGITATE